MRLQTSRVFWLLDRVVFLVFLSGAALSMVGCEHAIQEEAVSDVSTTDISSSDISSFFHSQQKVVVTFVGYSGSGYEDQVALLEEAERILDTFDPSHTIINIGVTPDGIGAIYPMAKRKGFVTTGIVSTQAKKYEAATSPGVDHVFYVFDATWGGFIEGSQQLSPTSTVIVQHSDIMIGIGGGAVARDELIAAQRAVKEVRFIPADMHHDTAREKAQKKGQPIPTTFAGAAHRVFGVFAEKTPPDNTTHE
jgi:hypothetical protein